MEKNIQKINLLLMAISFGIIVLGFALMAGAPSGEVYNPDIFSVRRIDVGPMVALLGFVLMVVGILYKPRRK